MAAPALKYSIGNAASTTLAVAASNSDTSMTITSDTNFAAKSGEGMVLIDESQATEEVAYSSGKSGATLTTPLVNRGLEGGSAQAHAINSTVKGILTAGMWNDMIDALSNVLVQSTGVVDTTKVVTPTGTQTLTNKTLTTPKIVSLYQDSIGGSNLLTMPAAADTLVGKATTDTLTNKRWTRRAPSVTQSATPTINTDVTDVAHITALAQAITSMTSGLSGTPIEGDILRIDITDNGTARAITWGASFESSGNVTLPTTTVLGVRLDTIFVWNTVTTKWRIVGSI